MNEASITINKSTTLNVSVAKTISPVKMRIAVNTRLVTEWEPEGYPYFIKEVFWKLAEEHPQHEFVFLFDRPTNAAVVFPVNVEPIIVGPAAKHPLTFRWWFDVSIPCALKKNNADVFISPDRFCSLVTNVPQVLMIDDLSFLHYRAVKKTPLWFYKRYEPRFLKKAKVICTTSEFLKQEVISYYKVSEEKLCNVGGAANPIFKPVEWQEKECIKEELAAGCEYFACVCSSLTVENLKNLLKAFSIFKKWQKTNMKLLLLERSALHAPDILEKLKTYKYRNDVKVLSLLPENKLAKAVSAAYAVMFLTSYAGFSFPMLEAMQCEVPVITSGKSGTPEVGGNAALYADPSNPEEIAAQMKLIFKDEQLRGKLIDNGRIQAGNFSWERTTELVWKSIQQAISE